jgi:RIO-like serine/threonine protein kinase
MTEVYDVATEREQLRHCCRRSFTRCLVHDSRVESDLAERLWSAPDGLIAEGAMIKHGDRTTVVRLSRPYSDVVLKRYNLRNGCHTACHALLRSRARRCWMYGRMLASNGIATPRPLAFLEQRRGPLKTRSFLLTEHVAGGLLRDVAFDEELSADDRHSLAEQFADIWRRLGELHLTHGDMKATNFVVDAIGRIWLIDLDGMRRHWSQTWFDAARQRDWRRFMKNWSRSPETAEAFRNALR